MNSGSDSKVLATLERRNQEMATLVNVAKALTSTLELDKVLNLILENVGLLLKSQSWSLLLVDEKSGDLHYQIAVAPPAAGQHPRRVPQGRGIAGWVAKHGRSLLIRDVRREPRFVPGIDALPPDTHSLAGVPVRSRERVLGVIELINIHPEEEFEEADLTILETVADFVAIALENARFVERINQLAITDELTGLYNASHFHTLLDYEMARARRYASPLALVFIDLDHFKRVNDSRGHLVGSQVLAETGRLIRQRSRRVNLAARYGGDEFIILLPTTGKRGGLAMAENLRQELRRHPFAAGGGPPLHLTASFGVAAFPEDATTKQALISLADQALYRVKQTSRDGVQGA